MSKPAPTIADILGIPGNNTVYEQLKSRLASGSAMAFIGAGASFPLYPLWGQLIGQLAEEPVQRGLAADADKQYWLRSAATKPLQVASQIHAKLEDPLYHAFLYETFKDRVGSDGLTYTPSHAALMRLNFKAYLTTNYDPGLVEARRAVRPEIRDSSFAVWNQSFEINRWASGDKFKSAASAPVLFAHGHFADPQNIVLDYASFRQAYHSTPYRRLFENLWFQEHLVFVGFSFSDVVLAQIADEVLSQTVRNGGSAPRHIAIIGLPESDAYTPEMRREYIDLYHTEPLFYPVTQTPAGHPDHSALQTLLDSLVSGSVPIHVTPPPAPGLGPTASSPSSASASSIPSRFVHETTEDEKFTGRDHELARLNGWAADDSVRLITITAIGGLGKTSLVGRWLKHEHGGQARHAEGIFFWSYYADRETKNFLTALVNFGHDVLGWKHLMPKASPLEHCLALLEAHRLIVVLDGLETVQESPDTVAYGKVLHFELAEFLHRHCLGRGKSLIVLTSRFPFPDLTQYLGGAMHPLPLPSLTPAEGSALLSTLRVRGGEADRESVSSKLFGHPLALRLFAQSMPPELRGDPTRLWERVFDASKLSADESLERKLRRLLEFYENQLPVDHRQVLGLIALFRMPVGESVLKPLWTEFTGEPDPQGLRPILEDLHRRHLLTADPAPDGLHRYACHPILRDHFRNQILSTPMLVEKAARLLSDRPGEASPLSLDIETIMLLGTAIELLLQAGDFSAADDLFLSRFDRGHIFLSLPAPHLGMEIARNFVRDPKRQQSLKDRLGPQTLDFYLNAIALYATLAGEPETAVALHLQAEMIALETEDTSSRAITLMNLGLVELFVGSLHQALGHFEEALELLHPNEQPMTDYARNGLGYTAFLQGNASRAAKEFAKVDERHRDHSTSFGLAGAQRAEFLLRCGATERARHLTTTLKEFCAASNPLSLARCHWMLGWLAVIDGRWTEASSNLQLAKTTFIRGHAIFELSRVLVTEALYYLKQRQPDAALGACERALNLAAPRKYRLVQADALNARARVMLDRDDPVRARDDAEAALQLAESCGYAWAERDALEILARANHELGITDEAARCRKRFDDWSRRLRLSI